MILSPALCQAGRETRRFGKGLGRQNSAYSLPKIIFSNRGAELDKPGGKTEANFWPLQRLGTAQTLSQISVRIVHLKETPRGNSKSV